MAPVEKVDGEGADFLPTRPGLRLFWLCWFVLWVAGCVIVAFAALFAQVDALGKRVDAQGVKIQKLETDVEAVKKAHEAEAKRRANLDVTPPPPVQPEKP